MSEPKTWTLKCEPTDDWWTVIRFPDGFYPRGETLKVVEASAYESVIKERDSKTEAANYYFKCAEDAVKERDEARAFVEGIDRSQPFKKLMESLNACNKINAEIEESLQAERAKSAKLVEALKFYALLGSWTGDDGEYTRIIDSDCYRNTNMNDELFGGLRALMALADYNGEAE